MMRKAIIFILSVLLTLSLAAFFVSCDSGKKEPGEGEKLPPLLTTTEATFIKELPSDVTIEYTLNKNQFLKLSVGEQDVASENYTQSETSILLKQSYLLTLDENVYTFTIVTDNGNLQFTLTVKNLADPDSVEDILNDPYYDVTWGEGNGTDEFPAEPDPDSAYGRYLRLKEANKPLEVNETITVDFTEEYWDMRLRPYTAVYDRPAEDAMATFTYLEGGGIKIKTNGLVSGIYDYIELRGSRLLVDETYEVSVRYKTNSGGFVAAFNGNGFLYLTSATETTATGSFVASNAYGLGNDILSYLQIMSFQLNSDPSVLPEIEIYEISLKRVETQAQGVSFADENGGSKSVLWSDRGEESVIELNAEVVGFTSIPGYTVVQEGAAAEGIALEGAQSQKNSGTVSIRVAADAAVGVYTFTMKTNSTNHLTAQYTVEILDADKTSVPTDISVELTGEVTSIPLATSESLAFAVTVEGDPKMPGFEVEIRKVGEEADVKDTFLVYYGKYFNSDTVTVYTTEKTEVGQYELCVFTRSENGEGTVLEAKAAFGVHGADPETQVPAGNDMTNLSEADGVFVENFAQGSASPWLGNLLNDYSGVLSLVSNGNAIAGQSLLVKYPVSAGAIFINSVAGNILMGYEYTIEMDVKFISGEPTGALYFGFRNNKENQLNKQFDLTGMKAGEVKHLSGTWKIAENAGQEGGGDFYMYMFFYDNPAKTGSIVIDNITITNNGNGSESGGGDDLPENLKEAGGSYSENFADGAAAAFLGNMLNDYSKYLSLSNDAASAVEDYSLVVSYPFDAGALPLFYSCVKGYINENTTYRIEMDVKLVSGAGNTAFYAGFRNNDDSKQFNAAKDLSAMQAGEVQHLVFDINVGETGDMGGNFYMYMFFMGTGSGSIALDNIVITNMTEA